LPSRDSTRRCAQSEAVTSSRNSLVAVAAPPKADVQATGLIDCCRGRVMVRKRWHAPGI
jgi:hypothetical protein